MIITKEMKYIIAVFTGINIIINFAILAKLNSTMALSQIDDMPLGEKTYDSNGRVELIEYYLNTPELK